MNLLVQECVVSYKVQQGRNQWVGKLPPTDTKTGRTAKNGKGKREEEREEKEGEGRRGKRGERERKENEKRERGKKEEEKRKREKGRIVLKQRPAQGERLYPSRPSKTTWENSEKENEIMLKIRKIEKIKTITIM